MVNEKFEMYSPEILDAARSFLKVSKSLGNLEPANLFKKLPSRPDLFPTDVDEDFFDEYRREILLAFLEMYRGELKENKTNKMSDELKRMQELAGVPVKKETESLNEHQIGGIVGVGAINQILPREKTDYEMAFEHFMTEGEEKKVEEASCGNYEEDDVKESYYEEDDPITGTDIDDIDMSPSVPDFGDDEIKGTELEEENKEAAEVSKLKSYLEGTGKAALQQINKKEELKSIFSAIFAGMSDTMKKNPSVAKIFDIANSKLK